MNKGNLSLFTNPLRSLRAHTLQQVAQQWMQQAEQQQQMVQESMNTYICRCSTSHTPTYRKGCGLLRRIPKEVLRRKSATS
jgi:hypothetical protein